MFAVLLGGIFLASVVAQEEATTKSPQKKIRRVQRVAKPKFDGAKGDIYFKDVFKDGLVGDRPDKSATTQLATRNSAPSDGEAPKTAGWSSLIDGTTIEDEIKSLNQELAKSVTTPVKFKTTYKAVSYTHLTLPTILLV